MRDSLISDSELGCVGLIQSLTHLYLQRPHEPRSDGRKKYDLSQDGDEFPDPIFAEKLKCNCWTERLDARKGIGDCAQWINVKIIFLLVIKLCLNLLFTFISRM